MIVVPLRPKPLMKMGRSIGLRALAGFDRAVSELDLVLIPSDINYRQISSRSHAILVERSKGVSKDG
jgi:hypothetical protein